MVSFFGTDTSPSSGDSSPTIIRKSVVLPEPFGPTRPTFSPGLSWKDASTKRIWRPYCFEIREKEIMARRSGQLLQARLGEAHGVVPSGPRRLHLRVRLAGVVAEAEVLEDAA